MTNDDPSIGESLESQVARLATFIMDDIAGEPSRNVGAEGGSPPPPGAPVAR